MEQDIDIRWIQRYNNFHKACRKLLEVTEADRFLEELSELEREGLIQRFEYTYELAWKVLQDLLNYKGYEFISGPNGTLKMALEDGLIADHDAWRRMSKARNLLTHTYNEEEAAEIASQIFNEFAPLLKKIDAHLGSLIDNQDYRQT